MLDLCLQSTHVSQLVMMPGIVTHASNPQVSFILKPNDILEPIVPCHVSQWLCLYLPQHAVARPLPVPIKLMHPLLPLRYC